MAVPIPRCYLPRDSSVFHVVLPGFSDASEEAYAAVVYICVTNSKGIIHSALVMSKTKVSPIKHISISRLELYGTHLLTKLLCHIKMVLDIPTTSVFAWTDSTIVLSWPTSNPP